MREVRIDVDGQTIHGKLLLPDGHGKLLLPDGAGLFPAVLFVHGWGATQRHDLAKARGVSRVGYACLTFNLRGHSRTWRQVQTVSRAHNFRDLLAAYDFLAADAAVDQDRIAVAGMSYGGYLAVLLADARPVRWLALQAPAIYQDGDFDRPKRELNLDGQLSRYRQQPLGPDDNRALAAAARFRGDVLVLEAEHDRVIPHQVIANYLDAFARSATSVTHHVIAGADHGLSEDRWRRANGVLLIGWSAARIGAPGPRVRQAIGARSRAPAVEALAGSPCADESPQRTGAWRAASGAPE